MRIVFPISLRLLILGSLVITLMASVASSPTHDADAASHPVVWGDVTCDNTVNLQDVADLMRRSAGIEASTSCPGNQASPVSINAVGAALSLRLDPVSSSATPGEAVTIAIFSDVHALGIGLGSASFDLVFDPQMMTPISCSASNGDCSLTFMPNSTRFAFVSGSAEGWTGTRKLGQVQYVVGGSPGQSTNVSLQTMKVGDQNGLPITSEATGTTISIVAPGLTPTPAPTTPAPTTYWYYADINCDGSITVMDALGVLEYLAVGRSNLAPSDACPDIGN